ncbi:DEAD-box type RNA helicase, partial [Coemansia aciculifera]
MLMPSAATIPRQVVKAPRSMPSVPVEAWASDHFNDPYAPLAYEPTIHARDVSKAALEELERERAAKSKQSDLQTISDDSDSSSSDDGDGDGDGDAATGKKKSSSGLASLMNIRKLSATRAAPRRTMLILQPNGEALSGGVRGMGASGGLFVSREAREQAQAKQKEKLRLAPSMNSLHRRLLGWEYEATGELPPDMAVSSLTKVPDWFETPTQYFDALEPLFMLESWAQFQRAKEEATGDEPGEG